MWENIPPCLILVVMNTPLSTEPPKALVQAVTTLLRPLVRLLLHFQITYPYLCQLLKGIYIDVASNEFQAEGTRQTDSRITMLTGVHRKDVRRFREEGLDELRAPSALPLSAQIVAAWLSEPGFQEADGTPRALPRLAKAGDGDISFEALVDRVARQDLRARSVLDEWLRLGLVEMDANDRVQLQVEAFIPEKGFDEKLYYFGKNLHDHISVGAHNLTGDGAPQFDRSVYYNNLSEASITRLIALVNEQGMQALKEVNRLARELQKKDAGNKRAKHRFNFGMFFYLEKQNDKEG